MPKLTCEACKGNGYLIDGTAEIGFTIERCDMCQEFDSDLDAAAYALKDSDEWKLDRIVIVKREG